MFGLKKDVFEGIIAKAAALNKQSQRKLVFPDTDDEILKACSIIKKRAIARPIIIGEPAKLKASFKKLGITNLDEENIIQHLLEENSEQLNEFANEYIALRKEDGKIVSDKEAKDKVSEPHFYGAMLVHKDLASGMISGFTSKTKPYYPAFEIIKTAPGVSKASGVFFMVNREKDKIYFFADCALVINPAPDGLAEIAYVTAKTAEGFGFSPKVAMLSFSTRDSAKHEMVEKVKLATAIAKKKHPELVIDGEIQVDAAIVNEVFRRKCPDSPLGGDANVLIFPDLNVGNISYKLVERLGGFEAIGPLLQGLQKPINDISRGCSADDVVKLAAITVVQSSLSYHYEPTMLQGAMQGDKQSVPKGRLMSPKAKSPDEREEALSKLPSNIRKIIDDHRKTKKEDKEDIKE